MMRSVLCSVSVAACCIVTLVLVPQARPDQYVVFGDSYAAIAYSPSTGKVGYSYDCNSRWDAERVALKNCPESDAKIVTWVNNGWCALAIGDDPGCYGTGFSWGDDASNTEARQRALAECRKRTKNAKIKVCICSEDVGQEVH